MSIKPFLLATSAIALMLPAVAMAQVPAAPATTPAAGASAHADIPSAPSAASQAAALPTPDPKSPVTHEEFSTLLRNELIKNPEMIVEAVKGIHEKQQAEADKETRQAIVKYHDELFKDTTSPSIGDPKTANVTMVEFFDYHCGYCKRMLPTIQQLHQDDPKVRIIFREFPILADDSSVAAKAALAVNRLYPEKYFAFHTALMNSTGEFNDKTLSEVAKKQGLDWKKIKKEMDNPDLKTILDKNRELAGELGIRGTPALVLGNQMVPGAMPYEELKKTIDNVRSGKDTGDTAAAPAPQAAPVAAPVPHATPGQ